MPVHPHKPYRPLLGVLVVLALLLLGLPAAATAFALFVVPPRPWIPTRAQLVLGALLLLGLPAASAKSGDKYLVGVGKADVTGPVVELPLAGYAKGLDQVGGGLRQRLYSRAFIFGAVNSPDRAVYLVLDVAMGDTAVRRGIIESLEKLGPEYAAYNTQTIALVATHSHSGPAGYHNYMLPQVVSLGLNEQSLNAQIEGAVRSIRRAHENLQEGFIDVGYADVKDGNINRSLFAYLANPASEQAAYAGPTDTQMTLLSLRRASDGKLLGVLNWYGVHGTSVSSRNALVSGDNKGVAAWLLERDMRTDPAAAPDFVAAFSQASVGDVSPNVLGQWCDDGSEEPCAFETSTCKDGTVKQCIGRGPNYAAGDNGVRSCFEMGRRQYAAAKDIIDAQNRAATSLLLHVCRLRFPRLPDWSRLDLGLLAAWNPFRAWSGICSDIEAPSASTPLVGPTVKAFHFFKDLRYFSFPLPNGTWAQTCPGALGYSFAAGTTDGPGIADFVQSHTGGANHNPVWKLVTRATKSPSARQKECQGAKNILLDVGEMDWPYAWSANIVDIQMLRVGQLVMIISPAEATTMSGRRWRAAVERAAESIVDSGTEPIVVLGGPANTYSHYVTTPEEYDVQRYEGASTLFGRHTLDAYINLTVSAIGALSPSATMGALPQGPSPPDNRAPVSLSLAIPVVYDHAPLGKVMGQVLSPPNATYTCGEVVTATFQGANPRNNLRLEGTFAAVEKRDKNGSWSQVRSDADWFLTFTWKRADILWGSSTVEISWDTGDGAERGTYRLRYCGDRKASGSARIVPFEGVTEAFELL
ncbi:Neutral ceramidase 2 [Vanrija pseudolonga]|uniref:Neutral ceramidase n=1 Tax=Vanrija pseudolonga TaxID=143232 RepID=A0AAF0Y2Y1_9TREE|nr:Neutral ceramidase 2 [Vanrija pseudolonga]